MKLSARCFSTLSWPLETTRLDLKSFNRSRSNRLVEKRSKSPPPSQPRPGGCYLQEGSALQHAGGAAHLPDGVHGELRRPDVHHGDPQAGGKDGPDSGAARAVIADHHVLSGRSVIGSNIVIITHLQNKLKHKNNYNNKLIIWVYVTNKRHTPGEALPPCRQSLWWWRPSPLWWRSAGCCWTWSPGPDRKNILNGCKINFEAQLKINTLHAKAQSFSFGRQKAQHVCSPCGKLVCGSPRASPWEKQKSWDQIFCSNGSTHTNGLVCISHVRVCVCAHSWHWRVIGVHGVRHVGTDHEGERRRLLEGGEVRRGGWEAAEDELCQVGLGSLSALRPHLQDKPHTAGLLFYSNQFLDLF